MAFSLLNFDDLKSFSPSEQAKLIVIMIFQVLFACLPFIYMTFLLINIKRLASPVLEKRYGALWRDLKTESPWTLVYIPLFMLRRGFFVLIVVYFREHSEVQWALYFYSSILVSNFSSLL